MHAEFDDYAQNYRNNLNKHLKLSGESSEFFAHYKVKKLALWLENSSRNLMILDFGCGDGLMTNNIAHIYKNSKIFGVDPSSKSIEIAQKNYPHISFSINNAHHTTLNFSHHFFDIIVCAGAFHHISFSMHKNYMHELYRILKPNGYLINFELNPLNPATQYIFRNNPIDFNACMLWPWYTKKLAQKYFYKTHIKFISFFPHLLKSLRKYEYYLESLPFGAQYAVIAQKV